MSFNWAESDLPECEKDKADKEWTVVCKNNTKKKETIPIALQKKTNHKKIIYCRYEIKEKGSCPFKNECYFKH